MPKISAKLTRNKAKSSQEAQKNMSESITLRQSDRLRDMAHDIERAKDHPSPQMRAAFERWTQAECDIVARRLRSVASMGSFDLAHELISKWYQNGATDELMKRVLGINS